MQFVVILALQQNYCVAQLSILRNAKTELSQAYQNITYKTTWVRVLFGVIKNRLGESNNDFNKAYLEFLALERSIKHTEIKEFIKGINIYNNENYIVIYSYFV